MKKNLILFAFSMLALYAFKKLNDVVTDVGSTLEEVKQITLKHIAQKDFRLPYYTSQVRNACQKLPVGVREATMMSLGKIVKDYVESPQFQKDYTAYLDNYNGAPATGRFSGRYNNLPPKKDWDLEKKKRADQTLKSMSNQQTLEMYGQLVDMQITNDQEMLNLLKESPNAQVGKTKEELQKELADYKMLKDLYTKDREAFKKQYAEYEAEQNIKRETAEDKKRREEIEKRTQEQQAQLKAYKEEVKDYKAIIRKQLQQFLAASGDVDYNAQLKQQGSKMIFVNPGYEAKPAIWKFCYRCGKEAVTGARKFAQEWLRTLK